MNKTADLEKRLGRLAEFEATIANLREENQSLRRNLSSHSYQSFSGFNQPPITVARSFALRKAPEVPNLNLGFVQRTSDYEELYRSNLKLNEEICGLKNRLSEAQKVIKSLSRSSAESIQTHKPAHSVGLTEAPVREVSSQQIAPPRLADPQCYRCGSQGTQQKNLFKVEEEFSRSSVSKSMLAKATSTEAAWQNAELEALKKQAVDLIKEKIFLASKLQAKHSELAQLQERQQFESEVMDGRAGFKRNFDASLVSGRSSFTKADVDGLLRENQSLKKQIETMKSDFERVPQLELEMQQKRDEVLVLCNQMRKLEQSQVRDQKPTRRSVSDSQPSADPITYEASMKDLARKLEAAHNAKEELQKEIFRIAITHDVNPHPSELQPVPADERDAHLGEVRKRLEFKADLQEPDSLKRSAQEDPHPITPASGNQ